MPLPRSLNRFDPGRRAATLGAFSLAALAVTGRPSDALPSRPGADLNESTVTTAELATRAFADLEAKYGGRLVRPALARMLAHEVTPRLATPTSTRVARRMFVAASQLAYLCAFASFDERRDALAEHYYLTALDLARHSVDPATHAITLRAMSVQAHDLGRHRTSLHLAEAALSAGSGSLPGVQQAFLLGQLSVARAADGDRHGALGALAEAERSLEKATSAGTSVHDTSTGRYHPASLAHQRAEVLVQLGDRHGAIAALTCSVDQRPPSERRSRALLTARLAELHLTCGHLDQATATWHRFLNGYPALASARADHAYRTMLTRTRPLSRQPAARDLLDRAADISANARGDVGGEPSGW